MIHTHMYIQCTYRKFSTNSLVWVSLRLAPIAVVLCSVGWWLVIVKVIIILITIFGKNIHRQFWLLWKKMSFEATLYTILLTTSFSSFSSSLPTSLFLSLSLSVSLSLGPRYQWLCFFPFFCCSSFYFAYVLSLCLGMHAGPRKKNFSFYKFGT